MREITVGALLPVRSYSSLAVVLPVANLHLGMSVFLNGNVCHAQKLPE